MEGKAYTKEADVYSFGLILWEILTHEKPFAGWKIMEIHEHIENGGVPPFPKDRICAEGYKFLIEKALAKNPDDRPSFEWIERALKTINPNDFEKK